MVALLVDMVQAVAVLQHTGVWIGLNILHKMDDVVLESAAVEIHLVDMVDEDPDHLADLVVEDNVGRLVGNQGEEDELLDFVQETAGEMEYDRVEEVPRVEDVLCVEEVLCLKLIETILHKLDVEKLELLFVGHHHYLPL